MKYLLIFAVSLVVALPTFATAQGNTGFEGSPEIGAGSYQQDGYTRVQTYDGSGLVTCEGPNCNWCSFVSLINRIVTWLIGFLSILAVLAFVYVGFKLVTSMGNPSEWESAKKMFTNLVIGLIIVLAAWLIVDTSMRILTGKGINGWLPSDCGGALPALVGGTNSGGVSGTTGATGDEAAVRTLLSSMGYDINKAPCSGQSYQSVAGGCTSVGGFTSGMMNSLTQVSSSCSGCSLVITGGSEGGHQTHGDGNSVDLRFNSGLDSFIRGGGDSSAGLNCVAESDHWHCRH